LQQPRQRQVSLTSNCRKLSIGRFSRRFRRRLRASSHPSAASSIGRACVRLASSWQGISVPRACSASTATTRSTKDSGTSASGHRRPRGPGSTMLASAAATQCLRHPAIEELTDARSRCAFLRVSHGQLGVCFCSRVGSWSIYSIHIQWPGGDRVSPICESESHFELMPKACETSMKCCPSLAHQSQLWAPFYLLFVAVRTFYVPHLSPHFEFIAHALKRVRSWGLAHSAGFVTALRQNACLSVPDESCLCFRLSIWHRMDR